MSSRYAATSELVAGLVNREPDAQEEVARLVYARVKRLAQSLCSDEADAEDIVQQVLLEVLRDAKTFRFEGRLEHWVDRITIRCALHSVRRERRRRNLLARWLLPGSLPWGTESKVQTSDPVSIDTMLARLAPERRQVVILHHGLGYSVGETAKILNTPRGTIKDRLVASKKQLRRMLRRELEDRGWARSQHTRPSDSLLTATPTGRLADDRARPIPAATH